MVHLPQQWQWVHDHDPTVCPNLPFKQMILCFSVRTNLYYFFFFFLLDVSGLLSAGQHQMMMTPWMSLQKWDLWSFSQPCSSFYCCSLWLLLFVNWWQRFSIFWVGHFCMVHVPLPFQMLQKLSGFWWLSSYFIMHFHVFCTLFYILTLMVVGCSVVPLFLWLLEPLLWHFIKRKKCFTFMNEKSGVDNINGLGA